VGRRSVGLSDGNGAMAAAAVMTERRVPDAVGVNGAGTIAMAGANSLLEWFSNIQNATKICNLIEMPPRVPIILKLCMWLHLNIVNNLFHLVNFKFPIEFML
jgi:hypothetical protein